MIDDLARSAPLVGFAYALGCVATGYYLVRMRTGADVRRQGSGGSGATNAMRVLGRRGFAAVFLADLAKGALAVGIARWFDAGAGVAALAGAAVVAGHVWPVQLGFRGGKGVATAFGAALVYDVWIAVAALLVAGVLLAAGVRFVPAGLIGTVLTPLLALLGDRPDEIALGFAAMAALVLAGHRKNIAGLLRHQEPFMRVRAQRTPLRPRPDRTMAAEGESS